MKKKLTISVVLLAVITVVATLYVGELTVKLNVPVGSIEESHTRVDLPVARLGATLGEDLEKRSYTSKTIDNGDGTFTLKAHAGHIHYKDETGNFVDSDFTPVDMGSYYEMTKHNYHLRVAKDFSASQLIQFKNVYEGANHTITYEPYALAWYDPNTDDLQIFRNKQSVQAVFNPEDNTFYYTNAFGNGIDFMVTIRRSGFSKEVVIPNKPSVFPTPPTENHKMVALFKYGGNGLKILKRDSSEWDNDSFFESNNGFILAEEASTTLRSFIRPAYAIDAQDQMVLLNVAWKKRNNQLWQIKEIPLNKFQKAEYPVRFDTVTDYYSGAGDGYAVGQDDNGATAHAQADADSVDYTSTTALAGWFYNTAWGSGIKNQIFRFFVSIDTSSIGSGATISDAKLYINPNFIQVEDTSKYMYVVEGLQASPSSLVVGDYDACGDAVTNPTLGDAGVLISTMSVGSYYSHTLDSTGRGWVNPTGTTKLCLRSENDVSGTQIVNVKHQGHRPRTSEYTGTASDPYLEVTYTVSSGNDEEYTIIFY